jgi:hypothetical protein
MQNARGGVFLFRLRGVTGAAADEYNLNAVDCNASVTVARRSSISVSGPAAGGKRKMVFRGLPRACWDFLCFLDKGNSILYMVDIKGEKGFFGNQIEPGLLGIFFF